MLINVRHNEIWARLRTGDREALLSLYNQHYVGLMNYGLKLTGDRELTNDCITQILLRLWDKRQQLSVVENPRSYLLTCLRHELFAERRAETARTAGSRGLQKIIDASEPSYEEYIIQLQTNKALAEKLTRALNRLTSREKELLRLKFFDDLDYDEIASRCGITKRTAYNIIHSALKMLKTLFVTSPNNGLVADPAVLVLVLTFILPFFL
jgi:RNA polymerase sigma-70 factor (ECF subfamily)